MHPAGNMVLKFSSEGRVKMVPGNVAGRPAANNDEPYACHRPTAVAFDPEGDVYVSDGYENAHMVKYNRDGGYLKHWGVAGQGDGQFSLVHDIAIDTTRRIYVADRNKPQQQSGPDFRYERPFPQPVDPRGSAPGVWLILPKKCHFPL